MSTNKININSNEFYIILAVLNEVCHGLRISNFEKTIGAAEQTVIAFMDGLKAKGLSEEVLLLKDSEVQILKNSFKEVFRQLEEFEFETRIGFSIEEAQKIESKLVSR